MHAYYIPSVRARDQIGQETRYFAVPDFSGQTCEQNKPSTESSTFAKLSQYPTFREIFQQGDVLVGAPPSTLTGHDHL